MNITNEMLDVFEDAEAKHTFTHGGDYRRCCQRAGLEAAAPLIAAQALRDAVETLRPMAQEAERNGDPFDAEFAAGVGEAMAKLIEIAGTPDPDYEGHPGGTTEEKR